MFVPKSVRIKFSNNIMNGEAYDTRTGEACQDYVAEVVKACLGGLTKKH